jgi:hypothetical protein
MNSLIQSPLYIVAFAGLLHASFQLGVGLLTLLSGHSLGSRRSFARLMQLNIAYVCGAAIITLLLFAGLGYLALLTVINVLPAAWLVAAFINIAIGGSVIAFYYRRGKGTGLWIPRPMARYLQDRTKKTKHTAEAFTLGAGSVLAEIPFLIAPLSIAVLAVISSSTKTGLQLGGFAMYSVICLFPLLVIVSMVGAGHKISTIQRWREHNKLFLQYCAGSGLIILGVYVLVDKVLGVLV